MNDQQDRQNHEMNPSVKSAIERIMELMLDKKWDEAQSEWDKAIEYYQNNKGLISISTPINQKINILEDDEYKKMQEGVFSEWKPVFESIRNQVLYKYYLNACKEAKKVSTEEKLCETPDLLSEDDNYQKAKEYASSEQKKHLLELQYRQGYFFVSHCLRNINVATITDLQYIPSPLSENPSFQKALKCASPELEKQLQSLIQGQVEHFVKKSMEDNHVERESELQYATKHLPLNDNYVKALKYATPKRKEELVKIQFAQAENLLKNYLFKHKDVLKYKKERLSRDSDFQQIIQNASPELQKELSAIQEEQEKSRCFWRKKKQNKKYDELEKTSQKKVLSPAARLDPVNKIHPAAFEYHSESAPLEDQEDSGCLKTLMVIVIICAFIGFAFILIVFLVHFSVDPNEDGQETKNKSNQERIFTP